MKTMARLAVALVATAAVGHPTASVANGMTYWNFQAPARLEGTWVVTIRPIYCSGPNAGADVVLPTGPVDPVTSHLTFGRGGTLVETTSNPALGAGKRSSGHGWWERTGRTSYQFAVQAFLVDPLPPYVSGLQRIEQTIELHTNDEWTSSGPVNFYDVFDINVTPAPKAYRSGCARASGVRMY